MMRSIIAVVAGLIITAALVMVLSLLTTLALGIPSDGARTPLYLALTLLGVVLAGIAGGATAMLLAPHSPHGHVIALALVTLILSLPLLLFAPPPGQPFWYGPVLSVVGPASVIAGGLLARRIRHRGSETTEPPAFAP